jgi:hypothetical protein
MNWHDRKRTVWVVTLYVEKWCSVERQYLPVGTRQIRVIRIGRYWADLASQLRFYADGTQTHASRGVTNDFRRRIDVPENAEKSA